MALGIPNRLIVLAIVAGALIIPSRLSTAAGVVTDVSKGISTSISTLGSTRIEPVFNPTISVSGNIGSRIIDRFLPPTIDDPTGDPIINDEIIAVGTVEEEVKQEITIQEGQIV